jgi:rod shape-determining protein MreD
LLSFGVSVAIDLMSFGIVIDTFRPDLTLLVLLYWSTQPFSPANVGTGWVLGLLRDVASLTPLGLNAGLYSVTAWVGLNIRQRLESSSLAGEMVLVLLTLLAGSILSWGVSIQMGGRASPLTNLLSPVVGALCWPLVRVVLDAAAHDRSAQRGD